MYDEITETSWPAPQRAEGHQRDNLRAFRGILNATLIAGALWLIVAVLVVL